MTQEKSIGLALGTQLVLALLLGLAVGLFFGKRVAFFKDIGNAFLLLLQMPMLPYITLVLITGLGQLTYMGIRCCATTGPGFCERPNVARAC
jgi:Na+/H+-dicarboxylate symporter